MKKVIALILMVMTLMSVLQIPMFAATANEVMPLNNNTLAANVTFTISSSGLATVYTSYTGYSGVTTGGTITTKLQKRFLGIFWTTVDIGTDGEVWVDSSSEYRYATSHTYQLSDKGTYRVVVEFVVRGTGGAADEIEQTREAVWE